MVSVSAVLVLAVIVVLLVRKAGLKVLHASLCVLLGFYLASSSMAPSISDFGDTMADVIDEISETAS
ncbi:hypothetical protein [Streptomyces sp. 6N223]|uniref:hypothetical protein n=1 Tax=Streptomyces sp. 6N223 TaxID=3457412 RepID=UPI003FD1D9E0